MRNSLTVIIFIALSIVSFSQKLSIEDIIKKFDEKSNNMRIEKIEKEQLNIEKTGLLYKNKMKTTYTLTVENYYYGDITKAPLTLQLTENRVQYPGLYSVAIGYDFVTVGINCDLSTETLITSSFNIGVSKSINDFFYDEKRYKENVLNIKEKQTENSLKITRLSKIEKIIDIYTEIINLNIELELKKNTFDETKWELEILKEKQKINEVVSLDVEYLQNEFESISLEIKTLKASIQREKKLLKEEAKLEDDNYDIEDLKNINIEITISDYDLKNKELESETEKENIKYYNRQNQTVFTPSLNYDIENKIWKAAFQVSGDIFNYNTDAKLKEKAFEKIEIEKMDIQSEMEILRKKKENECQEYTDKLRIYKERLENKTKRLEITKKMMDRGHFGILDYLKACNSKKEAEINYRKLENEFNGYKYKMKYIE